MILVGSPSDPEVRSTFSLGCHAMVPGVPIEGGEEVTWNPDLSRLPLPPSEWPARVRHGSFGGTAGGTEGSKGLHPRCVLFLEMGVESRSANDSIGHKRPKNQWSRKIVHAPPQSL